MVAISCPSQQFFTNAATRVLRANDRLSRKWRRAEQRGPRSVPYSLLSKIPHAIPQDPHYRKHVGLATEGRDLCQCWEEVEIIV